MKKTLAALLCLLLLAASLAGLAEETTRTVEYRDETYAFRYPADWKQRFDYDGSIILELPGTNSSVITFAMISNVLNFTGDEEADRQLAEPMIAAYDEESQREKGKNTTLNGSYELMRYGDLYGFRAYGTWLLSGEDLIMIILTGNDHLVAFQLNGPEAIALEGELLDSLELLGGLETAESGEWAAWENADYKMNYPAHYSATESATGVLFVNSSEPSNIIAARAYDIGRDYVDEMAPLLATNLLPASTNITADPVLEKIGGRTVAVIRGDLDAGTLAFYAFGGGQKAFVLMVTGEEALSLAEYIVESVELK